MDQYVWCSGTNLPGSNWRVLGDESKPHGKAHPKGNADLRFTTPELEQQVTLVMIREP